MKDLFIINARVIDPSQKLDGKINILVKNGKIAELTDSITINSKCEIIDAKDCIVSPGFIDLHCHLREPGEEYKEDIESGSLSAAAGGYTTICCMANTKPVNDSASVTEFIQKKANEKAIVRVHPIGAITKNLKGKLMADIGDMAEHGIVAISDDGYSVMNANLLRHAMEYATNFNLPVISHAEDLNLSGKGVMHEGVVSTELGLRGIPALAEETIIYRDILLAELTGVHLHIAHVSSAKSLEIIKKAKKAKISVTCEVTPHHLSLTDQAVYGYDPNTKMKPPLRAEEDKKSLIKGLMDGTIDIIATDHAPHNIIEKELGFGESAFGIIGFETTLPLIIKLINDKKLTFERMINALSCKPAQIMNFSNRGSLAKGKDADIAIFDPKKTIVINSSLFKSKSRNTPFNEWRLSGKILKTIVRGEIVYSA